MYVLITVDVEPSRYQSRPLPISKMVYGRFDDKEWGISKIMDICERYSFKATFFVDVLAHRHYGEEALKEICQVISKRGHDVQLHTHPHWLGDNKTWMFEYSLNDQIQIIREGAQLLYNWLNNYPIAHRAGGYSADINTIRALKENNIPIDSSFFPGYKLCKLQSPLLVNAVFAENNFIEVPITVFMPLKLGPFRNYRSVDIDSCIFSELKHVIKEAKNKGVKTLILFLHSFSFVSWNKDKTEFYPDLKDLERFEKVSELLYYNPDLEVITIKDFYHLYRKNPSLFEGATFVPHSGFIRTFIRACLRFNRGWKNKVFVVVVLVFLTFVCYMSKLLLENLIR